MDIKTFKTEEEYRTALKRLDVIFEAKENTPKGNEAELLVLLIENYENEHYPIGTPYSS